jgi:hypothetical protein
MDLTRVMIRSIYSACRVAGYLLTSSAFALALGLMTVIGILREPRYGSVAGKTRPSTFSLHS